MKKRKLLLALSMILLASCKEAPDINSCINFPDTKEFVCSGYKDGKAYNVPWDQWLNDPKNQGAVAFTVDDFKQLVDYCKRKTKEALQICKLESMRRR